MQLNHILSQITTTKIFVIDCNWSQRIPQVRLPCTVRHSWGKTIAVGIEYNVPENVTDGTFKY